ncbi:hypothetical protein [Sphingomonas sp. LY160]|uniref:hypothetical protein n=1 Tax=Sphingomonas sp. LY160 TaxID=3095342 RepID=UPI002ADEE5BE|nr:hypothetical protein [Sphingomonas sp. LY160]MEA1071293.1 hypothetical protein [Sphingomonas sp. LY160]
MRDKKKDRVEQGQRHALEIEASQKAMRESISETERLVDELEKILRRHRREREDDD